MTRQKFTYPAEPNDPIRASTLRRLFDAIRIALGRKANLDDATSLVPTDELGTGTASPTTFLRGDQKWETPAGGGGGAPVGAQYLVSAADPTLTAERVVGDTSTIDWDFATPGVATAVVPDDAITNVKLRNSLGSSVIGRSASTGGDPADIQATADGQFLQRSGGIIIWGTAPVGIGLTILAANGVPSSV